MPRIKSAIKRVEVAERNKERNRSWKSAIRTLRSKVEDACSEASDLKSVETHLKQAFAVIDRAVSKGILHKNTAARRKSRLVKLYRKAQSA